MSYTTKTIVANLTGKSESDIKDEWLTWADDKIETATGEVFTAATTETLEIDGTGDKVLILPKYPIIEITKIECDGVDIGTDQFTIYYDEGIISVIEGINVDYYGLDEVFAKGTKNIQITGKFGYSAVPKMVEELATLLVIQTMLIKYPNLEVDSEKIGDYSVTYKKTGNIKNTIDEIIDMLTESTDFTSTSDPDISYA
ncbi:MAG: hypothetical protein ACFFAU_01310 [Candidatus Hodarchaeota archaeon]